LLINLPAKGRNRHVDKRAREKGRKRDRRYKRELIAPSDVDEGRVVKGGSGVEERFICEAMRRLIHQSLDSVQVIKWIL